MERKPKNIFFEGPIPPEKVAAAISNHSGKTNIGAHSIFLGQVRADEINGETVQAIEYSAYSDAALEAAFVIREDIFQKYPSITCMHIYHSLGRVNTGEICFFVFTSSPRRKEAIEACNELVERIKKEVPIWGKEITQSGIQWKENQ